MLRLDIFYLFVEISFFVFLEVVSVFRVFKSFMDIVIKDVCVMNWLGYRIVIGYEVVVRRDF